MLLCLVKGRGIRGCISLAVRKNGGFERVASWRTRQGWATWAGSYEVTRQRVRQVIRGAADGSLAGQHQRVRQPIRGSGRPRSLGLAGPQVTVGFAGGVALEAADDLRLGQAFVAAPGDVSAGRRPRGLCLSAGSEPGRSSFSGARLSCSGLSGWSWASAWLAGFLLLDSSSAGFSSGGSAGASGWSGWPDPVPPKASMSPSGWSLSSGASPNWASGPESVTVKSTCSSRGMPASSRARCAVSRDSASSTTYKLEESRPGALPGYSARASSLAISIQGRASPGPGQLISCALSSSCAGT
jgi:hypothetical protein